VLELGLLLGTVLDEPLDFSDFGGHLHHPQVADLLGGLDSPVLEILTQTDDDRVETEGEQQLLLEVVRNLHYGEAVLLRYTLPENQRTDVVLDLPLVDLRHLEQVHPRSSVMLLPNARLQAIVLIIDFQNLLFPGKVDKTLAVDVSALLLG
jgi:hypothetical protein